MGGSSSQPTFTDDQLRDIRQMLTRLETQQDGRINNVTSAQMTRIRGMIDELSNRNTRSMDSFQERFAQQVKDIQEEMTKLKNKVSEAEQVNPSGSRQPEVVEEIQSMLKKLCGESKKEEKDEKKCCGKEEKKCCGDEEGKCAKVAPSAPEYTAGYPGSGFAQNQFYGPGYHHPGNPHYPNAALHPPHLNPNHPYPMYPTNPYPGCYPPSQYPPAPNYQYPQVPNAPFSPNPNNPHSSGTTRVPPQEPCTAKQPGKQRVPKSSQPFAPGLVEAPHVKSHVHRGPREVWNSLATHSQQTGIKFGAEPVAVQDPRPILPDKRDYDKVNKLKEKKDEDINEIVNKFLISRLSDDKDGETEKAIRDIVDKFRKSGSKDTTKKGDLTIPDGLILPDARDYKTLKTKSENNPKNQNWKKKENYQKRKGKASSVVGSVYDDGCESDSSVGSSVSYMSNASHVSNVSRTNKASGKKKVYWTSRENCARTYHFERAQNQIKKERLAAQMENKISDEACGTSSKSDRNKNQFKANANLTNKNKCPENRVDANANAEKTDLTKAPSTSADENNPKHNLSLVKYPTEAEAIERNSLDTPLEAVLFVGINEDGTKSTHMPTCLRDVYKYEKMYKDFYVISL